MMNDWNLIFKDFRERKNVDAIITIALIIAVVTVNTLEHVPPTLIAGVTLAALASLLYSVLIVRARLDKMWEGYQSIQEGVGLKDFLLDRNQYKSLPKVLEPHCQIDIIGGTLKNVLSNADFFLDQKLNRDAAVIRVLILKPNSVAANIAAKYYNRIPENFHEELQTSIKYLRMMQKERTSGELQVRVMDVNPNIGMILLDREKESGVAYVEFVGFNVGLDQRPHIEVRRSRDREWFIYFEEQFEKL